MTGIDVYKGKISNRINNLIEKNLNMPLRGFYYSMNYIGSENTKYIYINTAKRFMLFIGKTSGFTYDDYNYYIHSVDDKTVGYKINVYAGLKAFSKYLYQSHQADEFVMENIDRPKYNESAETIEKREKGYLTTEEIREVLFQVDIGVGSRAAIKRGIPWRNRDKSIILIFLTTGIRSAALCKLDIDSYDKENHILKVTDKGSKSKQYILSDKVCESLDNWIVDRQKGLDKHGNKNENALFISDRYERLEYSGVFNIVKKYSCVDGKHITPHKLRATYGTQLYNKTHDLKFVQENMNHASPKTTETYIRGQGNKTGEASKIMTDLLVG